MRIDDIEKFVDENNKVDPSIDTFRTKRHINSESEHVDVLGSLEETVYHTERGLALLNHNTN